MPEKEKREDPGGGIPPFLRFFENRKHLTISRANKQTLADVIGFFLYIIIGEC